MSNILSGPSYIIAGLVVAFSSLASVFFFSKPKPVLYTGSAVKIVIIGGSYGGKRVVENLLKNFKENPNAIEVTIIEKRAEFQHIMSNVRSIVDVVFAEKTWLSMNSFLGINNNPRFTVITGETKEVHPREVILTDNRRISFNYLVYATGTRLPAAFAPKSLDSKSGLLEQKSYADIIKEARSVVLIGGGPISIESAGEIKSYFPSKEVTIISGTKFLLGASDDGWIPTKFAQTLEKKLVSKGIKIILGEKVDLAKYGLISSSGISVGKKTILTSNGIEVVSDTQIIAVGGYTPNSDPIKTLGDDVLDSQGFVKVLPTLQLQREEYKHIFSLGDVAATGGPKMGVQVQNQAIVLASNLSTIINSIGSSSKTSLKIYEFGKASKVIAITIGKSDGLGFSGITLP
ncbi:Apoptosis-inducing factor 2, partial [Nowakowskiella sp. JEL0078]